jgi:hypothetical protein
VQKPVTTFTLRRNTTPSGIHDRAREESPAEAIVSRPPLFGPEWT